ncbi:MAG TPA: ribosome biogenesis GTPase Der [Polyangia bacterium]|nr:ribosome biogenesis GTPase Der [Polyangia bacterium]
MKPQPRRRPPPSTADDPSLPLVALVGRPNVGKSSLFNRLVGGRPALVEDMPGVTRDRRYGVAEWGRARFRVVDTGGLDPSAEGILKAMRRQTLRAVDEANVIVFVLDVKEGVTSVDGDVAKVLRRAGKTVIVAVNKVDSENREAAAAEVFRLGFPEVFLISASHGRGVGDFLDAVVEALGPAARAAHERAAEADLAVRADGAIEAERVSVGEPGDGDEAVGEDDEGDDEVIDAPLPKDAPTGPLRLAFVGKPNVGKSSLVNRLLGEERVLVHDAPGTTRDPIDTPFRFAGHEYVLVDTAGLRRRRSIDTLTEHVAAKMSRDQLERCDVAALVIDAREGATSEDARLASLIEASGRAALLVLNKKDLVSRKEIDKRVEATREELAFMSFAPVVLTSASTGAGVTAIVTEAARLLAQASRRISTGRLNKLFEGIVAHHPPPSGPAGRHVRLYYTTQTGVRPPTFVVSTNNPEDIKEDYLRFLTKQLRKAYGFEGTPIRIALRARRKKIKPAQGRRDER